MKGLLSKIFSLKKDSACLQRLEAIYSSIPDAVCVVDSQGRITSFNHGAQALTGFKIEELIDQYYKDIFFHKDAKGASLSPEQYPLQEVLKTGKEKVSRDLFINTSKGRYFPVLISIAPIIDGRNDIAGAAIFFRDITNEIKLEQLKSDFISVVSHELRIPLTAIKESINIVLEEIVGNINDNQRKALSNAKSEIERLARLLEELLQASKIESGRLKTKRAKIDLTEIVKKVFQFYKPIADKELISFSLDIAPIVPAVVGDSDRVYQVLSNLLSNAFKFTLEGGNVKVSCAQKDMGFVECSVIDTGCGIPHSETERLFERFEQLGLEEEKRRGGVGLGLYISKMFIEALGGSIGVKSKAGEGSTFTFSLPIYTEEMEFHLELEESIQEARKNQSTLAVLMLETNISGTEFDNLLNTLRFIIRGPNDRILSRNQYIFIMLADSDSQGALSVRSRIKDSLQQSAFGKREVISKFGVAVYPMDAIDPDELIDKVKANAIDF